MIKRKRKICVFSGKRGGFGAYVPLMHLMEADKDVELHILLGDMHVSDEFGATVNEARVSFPKAPIHLIRMGAGRGDTPEIRAENLGTCMFEASKILARIRPDIVMVHGDRGEHLVVALAGLTIGSVITHSQGGDVSGNIDEIQRHAITKLAHTHFPETKEAAQRIKRMGEESWRIHTVGSLYVDRIVKKMYTPAGRAKRKYGIEQWDAYAIALLHPETFRSREENYATAKNMFAALKKSHIPSVVIYPCSDPGYEGVSRAIDQIRSDPDFVVYKNIEHLDFLGLLAGAKFVIGNSSTGIKEAPYFQLPAINIGEREDTREREENVVDCDRDLRDMERAIRHVLMDVSFRKKFKKCGYHLGDGRASERTLRVIKKLPIDERLLKKQITF